MPHRSGLVVVGLLVLPANGEETDPIIDQTSVIARKRAEAPRRDAERAAGGAEP